MVTPPKPSITNLDMPNSEDPMELSSDIDRRLLADEDIDLDLDLTNDQLHDKDDEFMAEDSNSLTGQIPFIEQTVQDGRDSDMIYDRFSPQDPQDPQDLEVLSSLQDEDLDDAEYNELDDKIDAQQMSTPTFGLDDDSKLLAKNLQDHERDDLVSGSHPQYSSNSGLPDSNEIQLSEPFVETLAVSNNEIEDGQNFDIANSPHELNNTRHELAKVFSVQESRVTEKTESVWNATIHDATSEPSLLPSVWNNEVVSEHDSESQQEYSLENSTYLHPVMIVYQDVEMFLFPPVSQDQEDSQTYFLSNEKLATENVKSLLGACRVVLAESIEEDQELQITFDDLGLCISESSTDSSVVALSQIIDLYVQLQQNDGVENPEPLYLSLRTTTKFSNRFDYILQTAAEGKGLSQLLPLERIKEENRDHEVHRQQDWADERHFNVTNDPILKTINQNTLRNVKAKEDVEDQNPHTTITSSKDFNLNPQQQEELSKLNPLLAASNTTEALANDVKEPITNPGSSQISKGTPEVIQVQDPLRDPAGAPISHIQYKPTQYVLEDRDSISYEEIGDDPVQDSSTRSSTIQGDLFEAVISSSDSSLKKPAFLVRLENSILAHDTSEKDQKPLLNSQSSLSLSPPVAGTENKKLKGNDLLEVLAEESSWRIEAKTINTREMISTKTLHKHESNSRVGQNSGATQASNSHATEVGISNGPAPQYKKESTQNSNTPYTERKQDETFDFFTESSKPSKFSRQGTDDRARKLRIAKDIDGENALYSSKNEKYAPYASEGVQLGGTDQVFAEDDEDTDHPKPELLAENEPFLKIPRGLLSDADEITYDDDEPLEISVSTNMGSSPVSLKRMRERHEDDILDVGDSQETKRFRSE